jgi:hypothetical protein
VYVHPPTMCCRGLCRDCFTLPAVWGISTSIEMKICDIKLFDISRWNAHCIAALQLYSNCHHGSTVIFCYLLLCVEQLQLPSPTETSGSPSNASARSQASVQLLALRQETNRTRRTHTHTHTHTYTHTHTHTYIYIYSIYHGAAAPGGPGLLHCRGFMIALRHTTLGRTPLDEWSAPRRDLYLTTHNTYDRHPCPRRDSNPQSQQAIARWDRPN